jgi:hypothetical protein
MIKNIALAAIFFAVSAISISTATAVTTPRTTSKIAAPKAPAPQGLCFNGGRC